MLLRSCRFPSLTIRQFQTLLDFNQTLTKTRKTKPSKEEVLTLTRIRMNLKRNNKRSMLLSLKSRLQFSFLNLNFSYRVDARHPMTHYQLPKKQYLEENLDVGLYYNHRSHISTKGLNETYLEPKRKDRYRVKMDPRFLNSTCIMKENYTLTCSLSESPLDLLTEPSLSRIKI